MATHDQFVFGNQTHTLNQGSSEPKHFTPRYL